MKTSNKILIGSFLTALLVLTSVHIALYAKYKKGNYTLLTDNMWPMDLSTHLLKDVKYVSLNNIENISIRTADTSKLMYDKIEKGDDNDLTFTQNGDTLVVSGNTPGDPNARWYRRTELSLSEGVQVSIKNSRAHVRSPKIATPVALNFSLDDSFIEFNEREGDGAGFGSVNINAVNDSRIDLRNIKIASLQLSLKKSSFEEEYLLTDSIRVTADKSSSVKLGGDNLTKAKFFAHE